MNPINPMNPMNPTSPIFLDTDNLPFCKGCSHHLIARNTQKALQKIAVDPLDVILVTDIGCHGIIDGNFHTHTVHGLHGRSVALGAGISAALSDPRKKVIVFIGDGGTTIGLNHLISAAHRNFNLKVIVHNNMLYGMTGGQSSDLTPPGFNTRNMMIGSTEHTLDLFNIIKSAGAAYVSRITAKGDFSDRLAEAFRVEGFALIEVLEICPSYGVKYNQGLTLTDIEKKFAVPLETHKNPGVKPAATLPRSNLPSLFDSLDIIPPTFTHQLTDDISIILGGSAGEGVQVAADIFAKAAISCGLNVTKKGSYPVTVGIGYSVVEIILSTQPIQFTGIRDIHRAVVTSPDGLKYFRKRLEAMNSGYVLMDDQLEIPNTKACVMQGNFRQLAGAKDSILLALLVMLFHTPIFPAEAFIRSLSQNKIGGKIDIPYLKNKAIEIAANIKERYFNN
jgi:2-oxoglutarate ferredoxin oxidoreductase subunit beta